MNGMMILPAILLLAVGLLEAQGNMSIVATSTAKTKKIAITAGVLRCSVTTTTAGASISSFCEVAGNRVCESTTKTPAGANQLGGGWSCFSGLDMVTVVVWRQGNVGWQVVANGQVKSGAF